MYRTGKKDFKNLQTEKKLLWRWNLLNLTSIYQSVCLYLGRSPRDVFIVSRELSKQINEDGDN